jgi:predicted alpha/beta-fold hydrolase
MAPHLKEKGIDIDEFWRNQTDTSMIDFDDKITAPLHGYKNVKEYHAKTSCCHWMTKIEVPTFFLNAKDDPVIGDCVFNYEAFDANKKLLLGTTDYGGHIGYN